MMTNMIYDFDLKFSSMCKFSILTSATRRRTWDWWWICIFYLIVVFIIWSPGSGEVTLGSGGINNICIETGCSEATVKWSRRRQECRTLLQQRNQGGLIMGASIPHWGFECCMVGVSSLFMPPQLIRTILVLLETVNAVSILEELLCTIFLSHK